MVEEGNRTESDHITRSKDSWIENVKDERKEDSG